MLPWIRDLDQLLRGTKTGPDIVTSAGSTIPLRTFVPLAVVLGASYGFFMGWYSIGVREDDAGRWQMLASIVKVPALFLLTLVVTFPSLYVFSALGGCRLGFLATLRLLVAAIVVNLAVAAAFGPILAFFTVSTESYSFMILLNVALLSIAGLVGCGFLLRSLRSLMLTPSISTDTPPKEQSEAVPSPLHTKDDVAASSIFRVWVVIYALVGAQMGWVLRPFIGSPDAPFTFFRSRDGNFFLSVFNHLSKLFEM